MVRKKEIIEKELTELYKKLMRELEIGQTKTKQEKNKKTSLDYLREQQ